MKKAMTAPVLDPTCSARSIWFDKQDTRAVFGDIRNDGQSLLSNGQTLDVSPDVLLDFRALPFADESFWHVVFDPPHLDNAGSTGWLAAKYGRLLPGWEDDLTAGFAECFRVLRPGGTLIFKWSEVRIPLARVLALTPEKPLYGHRSGRAANTHWVAFLKEPS